MLISYLRVSTQKQGQSGLGLEAQRAAVSQYAKSVQDQIAAEFVEVESGRRCDRPQLELALKRAKSLNATLVVAKLDRLARNVAFLSKLMESRINFLATDNPHASRLTIHILAAVAEAEAEMISVRVKGALAAYKARGGVLGARLSQCRGFLKEPEVQKKGGREGNRAMQRKAAEFRQTIRPVILELREQGKTFSETADELNRMGYRTMRGKPWTLATVDMVCRHHKCEEVLK